MWGNTSLCFWFAFPWWYVIFKSFHVSFGHLYISFKKKSIQFLYPFWIQLYIFLMLSCIVFIFEYLLLIRYIACKYLLPLSTLPFYFIHDQSAQFSSVAQSCPTLCDPMKRSTPGLPVHDQLLEFTQTHIHRISDAIQPSHPLSSPFPSAPNPSQHQSLFQWVNSSHEVAKVLEFQPQHHSFQRTPRADLL